MHKNEIYQLAITDNEYPRRLKEIHSPPKVLYLLGRLPNHMDMALAVVGTRKTSPYGRAVTPTLVETIARQGIIIISGLALGIDALAHRAAINAGGRTIAVLGCG